MNTLLPVENPSFEHIIPAAKIDILSYFTLSMTMALHAAMFSDSLTYLPAKSLNIDMHLQTSK